MWTHARRYDDDASFSCMVTRTIVAVAKSIFMWLLLSYQKTSTFLNWLYLFEFITTRLSMRGSMDMTRKCLYIDLRRTVPYFDIPTDTDVYWALSYISMD